MAVDPPVALSRPVLVSSTRPRPLDRAPQVAHRQDSHPGPRFEDIAERAGVRFQYECGATRDLFIADTMGGGVALFDYDSDGWLDIYFVNGCPLPFDRKSPPRPNKLYRNRGNGAFEDVTERAGVAGRGYGMGCAVGDYDNDGHDDLFVTGLSETVLYRNRGDGTFEDVTRRAGVSSSRWTTAAGFGDLDGDGDLDLVVVTYVDADPEKVLECRDESRRPIHCPPATFPGQLDHLFRNNGNGTFTDESREAGIEGPGGRGLGLAIADLDGDGRLDLFVANDGTANFLFRNLGGLRFEEIGTTAGAAYNGMGQATASMGVVAVLGCGDDSGLDKRYPVYGTVTYNGKTIEKGQISFIPTEASKGLAANGFIENGKYTLTTATPGDGALPGEYGVTVASKDVDNTKVNETDAKYGGGGRQHEIAQATAKAKNLIPAKYHPRYLATEIHSQATIEPDLFLLQTEWEKRTARISYNLERRFHPCPRRRENVPVPRRRSPSFGSISWNTPPFRIFVTSTASTPPCSIAGRRNSSRTPPPLSSPEPDAPVTPRTGGSSSWSKSSNARTRSSRNSWKSISNLKKELGEL